MGDAGAPRWGEAAGSGGGGRRVRVGDLGGVRGNEQGHEGHDARELAHGGVCGAADGADEGCRGGEEIGGVRVGAAAVGAAAEETGGVVAVAPMRGGVPDEDVEWVLSAHAAARIVIYMRGRIISKAKKIDLQICSSGAAAVAEVMLRCALLALLALFGAFSHAFVGPYAGGGLAPALFRHPVSARLCASENCLARLENVVAELCAAVLQADDIGLLEQHSAGMGRVYMDGGFNMSRRPLMLRAAVREVMARYEVPLRPVTHQWLSGNHSESLPGGRVDFF